MPAVQPAMEMDAQTVRLEISQCPTNQQKYQEELLDSYNPVVRMAYKSPEMRSTGLIARAATAEEDDPDRRLWEEMNIPRSPLFFRNITTPMGGWGGRV